MNTSCNRFGAPGTGFRDLLMVFRLQKPLLELLGALGGSFGRPLGPPGDLLVNTCSRDSLDVL